MKLFIALLLVYSTLDTPQIVEKPRNVVRHIASMNGFNVTKEVEIALYKAAKAFNLDVRELTAIALVESGLGSNSIRRLNTNSTIDVGLFQINTVNHSFCKEYKLDIPLDNALCAGKLLSSIKARRADYLGVYHSKTPKKKMKYIQKINKVLNAADRYNSNKEL